MPVIVVGADTSHGAAVIEALRGRGGEIRAFVTDAHAAEGLRAQGVKVALGDISDASHVEGAALGSYCAVLMTEAAHDSRERAFARDAADTLHGWHTALDRAGVSRIIWVGERGPKTPSDAEVGVVASSGRLPEDVAADVAHLDEAARL